MNVLNKITINNTTYVVTATQHDLSCDECDLAAICEKNDFLADGIASLCISIPEGHCFKQQ